ncbi:MAG TPA: TonB-dependent receptor [Gemmatimonadaceae bacterium]
MRAVCRFALAVALVCAAAPARAQQPPAKPQEQPPKPAEQQPQQQPEEPQKYEETVVVSASKTEEKLINAPATMSVIGPQTIESAPSQNFAELLRTVPGLNITQVSARDINVTSRGATGTLATGQLAVLDGRSLYQDFFGFVMWDFLPVNFNEIKQIEVIRGPASAVWGANALYGVVNVITKTPREMEGTTFTLGVGGFGRSTDAVDQSAGTLFYVSGTHAQAVNDRWSYKLSAGAFTQDALPRPTGPSPGSPTHSNYPPYVNSGTTQPKFDGRVDYDYPDGRRLSFTGGVAGTQGIMHSGIGPFDINNGSVMGYGRATYSQGGFRAGFFTNILNGDADNLLTRDPLGNVITFAFKSNTYDFEASNVQTFQSKHVVSYGGNLRFNTFDLSLAPLAENRTEGGAYVQDEMFLSDRFRWVVGARVDRFDYLDSFVFSPRTTFMIKPRENHTLRLSYNRAYRSPSVVNNFLDVTLAEPIDLTPFAVLDPRLNGQIYPLPVQSVGNPDLTETTLDAYEIGYSGVFGGRTVVSAAFYVNRTKNDILFTELTDQRYTPLNPPPGWPLPPQAIALFPGGSLPARFTYLNFGETTQKGLELGVNTSPYPFVNVFANYSYQAEPDPDGFDISELNLPPTNRFNIGMNFARGRYLGDVSISYTGSAFWQDVLDDRFHGTTDDYTLVNGGFGVKWADRRLTTSVKVVNLLNQDVQQHVFGDILTRLVVGEVRVEF